MVLVCAVVLVSAFSSSASPPVPSACCCRSSSLMFGWRCSSCKSCVLLSFVLASVGVGVRRCRCHFFFALLVPLRA
ncbi:hypothetical protein PF005_g2427 [Phytophthora fragariae]|uniref:Secreted protein n=1 Tax=Phytophthora fragariae TaxID=53985 RepID=A0A6A3FQ27_9STRA|nr:hypothetical protein PF003_g8519 [Phytophthora fragariae]KAE8946060.1 hypothetical protein PF009_g4287 [Phytophthora fragariae]KAE9025132.1 hypothetical protein PF011_g3197 [Phytophthora fragariae]KAE9135600.1 hypothetical protein PF010_g2008 [Phytophthora fragariae]KAE9135923.1 hypothetical protein PF007_g2372 [Phytophthora fragariae]